MRVGAALAGLLLLVGIGLLWLAATMDTSETTSDRNVVRFWAETFVVLGGSLAAAAALTFGLWRRHIRRPSRR
jgi:multisubunit Na+/H+ antiporter MnhB subunit